MIAKRDRRGYNEVKGYERILQKNWCCGILITMRYSTFIKQYNVIRIIEL